MHQILTGARHGYSGQGFEHVASLSIASRDGINRINPAPGAASGVTVNLSAGTATDGSDTIDHSRDHAAGGASGVYVNLEAGLAIDGFAAGDVLVGSSANNTLDARRGRDIFVIDAASLIGAEYDLIADCVPGIDTIRVPLAMQDHIQVFAEPGTISLLIDTGAGYYALNAQTTATEAAFCASITYV